MPDPWHVTPFVELSLFGPLVVLVLVPLEVSGSRRKRTPLRNLVVGNGGKALLGALLVTPVEVATRYQGRTGLGRIRHDVLGGFNSLAKGVFDVPTLHRFEKERSEERLRVEHIFLFDARFLQKTLEKSLVLHHGLEAHRG